jgi:hypothetical protein
VPTDASGVSVMAAEAPRQVMTKWTRDPEEIAETLAAEMQHHMLTY